jgi:alpha-N-arabinofuranosidase
MNPDFHYDLYCRQLGNGKQSLVLRYRLGLMNHIEKEITLPKGKLYLRVKGGNEHYTFLYSTDNVTFHEAGKMDTKLISTETAGGFTGIYIGLYATASSSSSKAYADFDWFDYAY